MGFGDIIKSIFSKKPSGENSEPQPGITPGQPPSSPTPPTGTEPQPQTPPPESSGDKPA